MGYTHYWRRAKRFSTEDFLRVVKDFRKMLPFFEAAGIPLADWDGKGKPAINNKEIRFNGVENCSHEDRDLGITWPSEAATGCLLAHKKRVDIGGQWFAGLKLNTRTCDGDCSHESFVLEKEMRTEKWQKPEQGKYFTFCKTAYKPYDVAVNVCLIIAKHYLKSQIKVSSDGELHHWKDAMKLCQRMLGYGLDFKLGE